MFGFSKKRKPVTALDKFIFAVYGNPPPPKQANVEEAISLASNELLLGIVKHEEIRRHALALAANPIPYSTHDLALSVALNFFQQAEYAPRLRNAQLAARTQNILWLKDGLVVRALAESFEDTLYKLYKPAAPERPPTKSPKSIPAPDNER